METTARAAALQSELYSIRVAHPSWPESVSVLTRQNIYSDIRAYADESAQLNGMINRLNSQIVDMQSRLADKDSLNTLLLAVVVVHERIFQPVAWLCHV